MGDSGSCARYNPLIWFSLLVRIVAFGHRPKPPETSRSFICWKAHFSTNQTQSSTRLLKSCCPTLEWRFIQFQMSSAYSVSWRLQLWPYKVVSLIQLLLVIKSRQTHVLPRRSHTSSPLEGDLRSDWWYKQSNLTLTESRVLGLPRVLDFCTASELRSALLTWFHPLPNTT